MKKEIDFTNKGILKKWFKGEEVWSVSMGGLGEGYEMAIQTAIFALLRYLIKHKPKPEKLLKGNYFDDIFFKAKGVGKDHSGGTASQAKQVAYQFYKYGYKEMMEKAPENRLIKLNIKGILSGNCGN